MCRKPDQRLYRNYTTDPNECPLRRLNVLFVSFRGEVDGEEGWPNDEKWPDIGMKLERKGIMKTRRLYLRVVDERHGCKG